MKVDFVAANPRRKARPELDRILAHGVDQLAIACAFLTGGGAEVLKRHAARLSLPNSFLVVAYEPPTDLEALAELHSLFPGNLYLHLGAQTPVEKKVGRGLMHSKVFFARAGDDCRLWTGSHNLTASAAQGVNCEAAIVLEGSQHEQPFLDAMAHLNQCKQESVVYDPFNLPPVPSAEQTLVIHAEAHVALRKPPWFVHLRPATTIYDRVMLPQGAVWLFVYAPGTLKPGVPRPRASAAYSGTLTGFSFTESHPQRKGTSADWQGADYVIEQAGGVFQLNGPQSQTRTPTQSVFRVELSEDTATVWLTDTPAAKLEKTVGLTRYENTDPEFLRFFTQASSAGEQLIYREYRALKVTYRVPQKEVGSESPEDLFSRLRLPKDTHVEVDRSSREDKFEFIYRAKYRA